AAAPAAAPAATSGAAAGPAVPDSFTSATQASQAVVKVAKYLLTQDSKDARGYRLMRAVHFGALSDLPKDRLLPPPPPPRRQFFENAATGGDWPNLLTEAEGQFAVTPLWLDVQRYVAMALKGLGGAYAAAHAAVVFDTIAVARRLPGLFDLSFKDGSSFADGATKAWLEDIQGEFGGGGGGGGGSGDALATAVGEARKLLSAAKAPEAIARLSAEIDGSASRRQQFRAQLALAGFCLDMNKVSLAVSLLEGLEGLAERYQLQDWEPDLAAETYRQLYEALRKSKPKPTPEDLGRLANVFACLCRLNPAAALKLDAANK
ncbi:MAG: type VI secretion system domain-containing protein, partial [Planctomycetes bacterium]|nr:type VI secretion system domain-containing protein [Planctomycetota bacterium]